MPATIRFHLDENVPSAIAVGLGRQTNWKANRSNRLATVMVMHDPPFKSFIRGMLRLLTMIWASPYTLIGLFFGVIGLTTGGGARIRGHVVEFYGGGVKWLLQHCPDGQFMLAITLGHAVLGQTDASLDIPRAHELVHVRQYERWGPFMGPAYLICALVLWLYGRQTIPRQSV